MSKLIFFDSIEIKIIIICQQQKPNELAYDSSETTSPVGSSEENYLSDYIQSHKVPLPDLSLEGDSYLTNDQEDGASSWDENWVFRKRISQHEVPTIAMLVPSPTEDIKALIGDRTADETSDLSEADDSDRDLQDFEDANDNDIELPHVSLDSHREKNDDLYANAIQTLDYLLQPEPEFVDDDSLNEAKNSRFKIEDNRNEPKKYSSEADFSHGVFNEVVMNNHKTAFRNGVYDSTEDCLPEKDDSINFIRVDQKETTENSDTINQHETELGDGLQPFNGTSKVFLDSVSSILQDVLNHTESELK